MTLAVAFLALPASAAPPELRFEDQAVAVSGATPGGSVAIFGVSHGFNGFTTYFLRNDELLVDEDGDGSVQLELELPLSKVRSVWAAVDLASGELAVAAPEGAELFSGALPSGAVSAEGDEVTAPVQRWAYALWVRPGRDAATGTGAWGAIVRDGDARDGDGLENREVRAGVSSFVPIVRVSRPLQSAPSRAHLFIVTHASGPGDRGGRIRSFGELPNGNMGEVHLSTTGSRSEGTTLRDTAMWYSLTDPAQAETAAEVDFVQIDAPDDVVAATADALMPNQSYSISIGVRGVNSNSAAVAIAETASGQAVQAPGGRPAPGAEDSDMVDFDLDDDGVPDDLDRIPE